MKLEQLLLAVTLMLVLSPAQLVANTIDGSINLYERPSLSLDEALTKAKEALGREADKFVCTEAKSKKRLFRRICVDVRCGGDSRGALLAPVKRAGGIKFVLLAA